MKLRELAQADIVDWTAGKVPPTVAQVLFGLACTVGFLIVRFGVDTVAPTAGPFSLIYLATLVSTLFGRWGAGLVTYVSTFLWTWYFLLPGVRTFHFAQSSDIPRTLVNAVTILVIVIFAETFRRAVRSAARERDAAVANLQDREQRLQLALSTGRGIGTWDWDIATDRAVADERFARLYGVDPARASAGAPLKEFFSAVHSDDLEQLQVGIDKALRTGAFFTEEYRLIQADGSVRWVAVQGQCSRDEDGTPVRFPGVSFDITDRKTAERLLRDLNADLERKVIERTQERGKTWQLSPDLLGALNSRGYFETSNPAWEVILGWSEAEVAATSIFELLHPDDLEHTRAGFNLTQIGQPAIRFENRYRCKDGSYRWISWVGIPDEGLVYCTGRDVTTEKTAERELAAAQDALRQSQKMEAIGQLTGGIAHDFNNMLTGIVGSLDIIRRRMAAGNLEDIPRFMDAATTSAQRAAALTHRLLAFARRQSLDTKPNDINRLVTSTEELLRRTLGEGIELQLNLAPELWTAFADANQFESAILNLAINARDAMPNGGELTIETENTQLDEAYCLLNEEVAPGDYVVVSVSDNGEGMAPDVVAKAIDPFFTTKPLGVGTGLGLSMIYGFAKQSRGHLRICSEVGLGTTIKLYLPRALHDAVSIDAAIVSTPRGQGETILVVEDDDTVRMLVVEVLEELGYSHLAATDARGAIPILQSDQRIDLLITDVGLPHINGRQLAEIARETRPDLKVLFVTGYAENATFRGGFLDPGMDMLTKPFAVGALGAKVREMIER